ncbi:hypothetical protein FXO38_01873 [Capsicum annuum]|nr:hypothetical protein FXO38_01873 [Capsicum annuum]
MEGVHVDSSLPPQADKAMKMFVESNLEKALFFSCKSSAVVASTEETLKMTSPSCEALPAVSNGASVEHLIYELEFDENCVLVDKDNDFSSSEFHDVHISNKKNMPRLKVKLGKQRNKDATKCEDHSVKLEHSNIKYKTETSPNEKLELS